MSEATCGTRISLRSSGLRTTIILREECLTLVSNFVIERHD